MISRLLSDHNPIRLSFSDVLNYINGIKKSPDLNQEYLFTIITVNYNNASGLARTIQSVKQQVFSNYQYLVIDGCSSDSSPDVIKRFSKDIDIAIIEKDSGVYNAMNKGLELALGKYILFLNSGDTLANQNVLRDISEYALRSPQIIYGNTRFQENKKIWRANTNPLEIWKGMVCSHQSIFISNSLISKYKFNESLKIVADWNLISSCILSDYDNCLVADITISEIEPVGISSDFMTRTLERWNLLRDRFSSNMVKLQEIDSYYLHLINSHKDKDLKAFANISSKSKQLDSRLIFLISMPRSGSTMLQRILESSDHTGSCGESWVALPPLAALNSTITNTKYETQLADIAFREASKELNLDKAALKDAQKVYLNSIYSKILEKLDKPYFVDKTPRYIHIIDELRDLYADAKFILLLREPSAIINSYASTWCNNDYRLLYERDSFRFDFEHGLSKLIRFANKAYPNVLTVRYEDLCLNPEDTCKSLSKFLGFRVAPVLHNTKKSLNRVFGDPKQINFSSSINARSVNNSGKRGDYYNLPFYDKVCDLIPRHVWDYFSTGSMLKREYVKNNCHSCNMTRTFSTKKTHAVVITSFNNESTIISAISSVVNQSLRPNEIIIIDDCSTDNSVNLITNFIQDTSSLIDIRLIVNSTNIGVSSSRHKAICESSTEYISTLDGDDTITPLKIEMEMRAISQYSCEVAFSDTLLICKDGSHYQNTRGYHQKTS